MIRYAIMEGGPRDGEEVEIPPGYDFRPFIEFNEPINPPERINFPMSMDVLFRLISYKYDRAERSTFYPGTVIGYYKYVEPKNAS